MISILLSITMNPMLSEAKGKLKYAKTTINIRAKPSIKSKIVGKFYWNDTVKIIKKINKKWYQVSYNKKKRYVCARYLKKNQCKPKVYISPSNKSFKAYEDAKCITNNSLITQGKLKKKYHLDYQSGVWMVENRYCVALGSFYSKKIGVKVDLVLSYKGKTHILKCITADCKSDRDTVNRHRIHKDGSVAEFVVNTRTLSRRVRKMGDISFAGKKFRGKIIKLKIYK